MTRTYWFESTPITGKSILFGKLGPSKPTGIDTGKGRGTDTDEEEVKATRVESCQGKIHEILEMKGKRSILWENVDRKSPDFASNSEPVNSFIEMELEEVIYRQLQADFLPAGPAKCCGRGGSVPPAAASSASAHNRLFICLKRWMFNCGQMDQWNWWIHTCFFCFSQATCIKANVYGAAGKCLSRTATRVVAWINFGAVCLGWIGLDVGTAKTALQQSVKTR